MEATLKQEVAESIVVETKEELVKELSNIDLMLVGGGIANVSFF
jgi:predicted NodU family carbamoyl transferase